MCECRSAKAGAQEYRRWVRGSGCPASADMTMRLVGAKRKKPITRAGGYRLQPLARDPQKEAHNSHHDTETGENQHRRRILFPEPLNIEQLS
jgi:hypothetical protein